MITIGKAISNLKLASTLKVIKIKATYCDSPMYKFTIITYNLL